MRQHRVEEVVGDLLDPGAQALHPAHGEGAGDEAAQPGVLGRVAAQQMAAYQFVVVEQHADAAAVLGQPGIRERGAGLLVADDEPGRVARVGAGWSDPVDGAEGAQLGVHGVRIDAERVAVLPQVDH